MFMRRLIAFGLILTVLSVTPASVFVCGSVMSPEAIYELNDGQAFTYEVDCTPVNSVLYSSMTFSLFMQSAFTLATVLSFFLLANRYLFVDNWLMLKYGRIIPPPTPPPTTA